MREHVFYGVPLSLAVLMKIMHCIIFYQTMTYILLQAIVIRVSGSSSFMAHLLHVPSSSSSSLHVAARHDDDTDNREAFLSTSCLLDNFHYPHHCAVPYCDFMVAWREEGEMVTFNLTAKVAATSMVWAAIGFSDDRRMVR